MSTLTSSASPSTSVFRIDRFVVPGAALPDFMHKVRRTQQALDGLAGCRQNLVLSQAGAGGQYNVVTVVEWADADALAAAQGLMKKTYAAEGFDPGAFMKQLGVQADMGLYGPV
ncbi:MAG: antibiotic biosynthesis monooxygenase [Rhizobacter sp.]|nr:antibiotic biosynthesis monooxygenase [Rhizobacter sp.]